MTMYATCLQVSGSWKMKVISRFINALLLRTNVCRLQINSQPSSSMGKLTG